MSQFVVTDALEGLTRQYCVMIARHWPLTSQAPKHATGELPRGQQGNMETRHRLVHACFASEDSVRKAARLHGEAAAGVPRCLSEFPGDSSRMTAMRPT